MTQTILGLTAVTIFGFFVSIISIRRFLRYRKIQDESKMKKKQIVSSIIGMVLSIPVTLFFVIVLTMLIFNLR
jgi:uncharacterized membrane protein